MSANTNQNPGNIRDLIGLHPFSENLSLYLTSLETFVSTPGPRTPEVKSYPDAVYLNYYALGLSLLFSPLPGYKPATGIRLSDLESDKLVLNSIDMYNVPNHTSSIPRSMGTSSRIAELAFSTFPLSSFALDIIGEVTDKDGKVHIRPAQLKVHPESIGKDFVQCLGEPDRKGGGAGPSSGSIGIWCEWTKDGVMVEFGGDEAKGPQAWERGKDAVWKVITLFSPGHE